MIPSFTELINCWNFSCLCLLPWFDVWTACVTNIVRTFHSVSSILYSVKQIWNKELLWFHLYYKSQIYKLQYLSHFKCNRNVLIPTKNIAWDLFTQSFVDFNIRFQTYCLGVEGDFKFNWLLRWRHGLPLILNLLRLLMSRKNKIDKSYVSQVTWNITNLNKTELNKSGGCKGHHIQRH